MTMKGSFCNEVTSACAGQPFVADYPDGQTFCEKHVGSATAGNDAYWSFPFVESERAWPYVSACRTSRATKEPSRHVFLRFSVKEHIIVVHV